MNSIETYLIYNEEELSAVETAKKVEEPLTKLDIQAVACHREGKSNLILEKVDPTSEYKIRKEADLILKNAIVKLKKEKDLNFMMPVEKENIEKFINKIYKENR